MNADAQRTIQWIINGTKRGELTPCNIQCQKRNTYVFGVSGTKKLKSQVSGKVCALLTKFIAIDERALKQFNEVSPNDAAGLKAIGCNVLKSKNQLLQQFYRSPY